jgi:hypothetical protein
MTLQQIGATPPPLAALTAGRYLRLRREAAGLSVAVVARALGITPGARARIRNDLLSLEADQLDDREWLIAGLRILFPFDCGTYFALIARAAKPGAGRPVPQVCRGCACSLHDPCQHDRFGPCAWLPNDPTLCDACARRLGFLIMALAIVAMSPHPVEFIGAKWGAGHEA